MKRQIFILAAAAVAVAVILVLGVRRVHQAPAPKVVSASGEKMAPDFTLQSLDGKAVRLSDFHGKAVLLNFWATWCEPCKVEMPWFVELQKQYGPQGLQIVGVSMDTDDVPEGVAKFAKTMGVDYPILVGKEPATDAVASLYGGVQFLPVSFYIDRQGKIVDKVFGLKGRGEIEDLIKKTLGPGTAVAKSGE